MSESKLTADEALEVVREFADEIGHSPKKEEFARADSTPSVDEICSATGLSFTEARSKAGLEPPHRHDGRKVALDVDYFAEITTPDRAYWLGTLFGHSAVRRHDDVFSLLISHTVSNRHFAEGLYEAIEAGYATRRVERLGEQDRIQFSISNRQFLRHLEAQGLDDSGKNVPTLPDLPEDLRRHFLRGFFEVRGRVTNASLTVRSDHREKLETAAEWTESLGVRRTTVSELASGGYSLRVGSEYDVARLLETCWANLGDERIWSERFYEDATEQVCEEHQFPEKLSFCGESRETDDGESAETGDGEPAETGDEEPKSVDGEEAEVDPGETDDGEPGETGERVPEEDDDQTSERDTETSTSGDTTDGARTDDGEDGRHRESAEGDDRTDLSTVSIPTTLAVALGAESEAEPVAERVGRHVREEVSELVTDSYPDDCREIADSEATVEVDLDLPRPTAVAVRSLVADGESPFETVAEFVVTAVSNRTDAFDSGGLNLQVDTGTAALLEILGDGDISEGAVVVVSELAAEDARSRHSE